MQNNTLSREIFSDSCFSIKETIFMFMYKQCVYTTHMYHGWKQRSSLDLLFLAFDVTNVFYVVIKVYTLLWYYLYVVSLFLKHQIVS